MCYRIVTVEDSPPFVRHPRARFQTRSSKGHQNQSSLLGSSHLLFSHDVHQKQTTPVAFQHIKLIKLIKWPTSGTPPTANYLQPVGQGGCSPLASKITTKWPLPSTIPPWRHAQQYRTSHPRHPEPKFPNHVQPDRVTEYPTCTPTAQPHAQRLVQWVVSRCHRPCAKLCNRCPPQAASGSCCRSCQSQLVAQGPTDRSLSRNLRAWTGQ